MSKFFLTHSPFKQLNKYTAMTKHLAMKAYGDTVTQYTL